MANVRAVFDEHGRVNISLEDQHISRMSHAETRSLICSLLVFGGKQLREEIHKWLNNGTVENFAGYIAPDKQPPRAVVSGQGIQNTASPEHDCNK